MAAKSDEGGQVRLLTHHGFGSYNRRAFEALPKRATLTVPLEDRPELAGGLVNKGRGCFPFSNTGVVRVIDILRSYSLRREREICLANLQMDEAMADPVRLAGGTEEETAMVFRLDTGELRVYGYYLEQIDFAIFDLQIADWQKLNPEWYSNREDAIQKFAEWRKNFVAEKERDFGHVRVLLDFTKDSHRLLWFVLATRGQGILVEKKFI